jgi:hypothetical protein
MTFVNSWVVCADSKDDNYYSLDFVRVGDCSSRVESRAAVIFNRGISYRDSWAGSWAYTNLTLKRCSRSDWKMIKRGEDYE